MSGLWANIAEMEKPTSPNAPEALASASYLLWVLSGRRWSGLRTATEEYVCDGGVPCCAGWVPSGMLLQIGLDHFIRLTGDPNWGHRPGQRFLFLRHRPVRTISSVRRIETGVELDLDTLAVYDYAYLAPVGAAACDPWFDPCGLEVTYSWGTLPPAMGRTAALDLANQLVKSIECPDECTLPERVTSVSRQGVNFQVFDAQDFLADGRVGIYSVDVFLKAVNPAKAQLPARVFSPDLPRGRRRTWVNPQA